MGTEEEEVVVVAEEEEFVVVEVVGLVELAQLLHQILPVKIILYLTLMHLMFPTAKLLSLHTKLLTF